MTVLTDAINALIALLDNCTLADHADFVSHTFYKTVVFRPEYPLNEVNVPCVALSLAGGVNQRKGLGWHTRWHETRLQLDVLAANALDARRIYEKVAEVLLYDLRGGAAGTEGTYGTRYLYGKGIKSVQLGEPMTMIWDEEGRIARIVADMTVEFTD